MPNLNLTPSSLTSPITGGTPWVLNPLTGVDQLRVIDGKTAENTIPQGGIDSNSMRGLIFHDAATGLPPVWSAKMITGISVFINAAQLTRPTTSLQIIMADATNPNINYFEVFNADIVLAGGAGWQAIANGAVAPPGTYNTFWDNIRDWVLAQNLLYSVIHYFHAVDASQSFISMDAMLVAVDYTTVIPPPAPPPQQIWEV